MKKVGVLAVKTHNYGSLLQTYALQKVLDNLGYDNEIIEYKKTNILKQAMRLFYIPLLKQTLDKAYKKIYLNMFKPELKVLFLNRTHSFDEFTKMLRFSPVYEGRRALKNASTQYDAFVLGSDQVWNPMNFGADFFSMTFVQNGIKKIAYAPSFGVSKIPGYQKRKTAAFLDDIDYLSVREISGQKLIDELTGKKAKVVVDPTILLDRKYWDEIKGERLINEPYIMCYFLGKNPMHRNFANRLKEKTGYSIVCLPHMDAIVKADFNFGDIIPKDIGPKEFINLISNAEYVCTDSFHGTVFSILYRRIFFTFNRYESAQNDSTNSRLDSILTLTKLASRKLNSSQAITDDMLKNIDYSNLSTLLDELKEDSLRFLVNSLEK